MSIKGNCIVAQSGGPTAVINTSALGVIETAMKSNLIEGVYSAKNGILGVLNDELFDLRKEDSETIQGLRNTPSSALGSNRYKLKSQEDLEKLFANLQKHNIRYFFYIGGNDSMDTADKLNKLAKDKNYEMYVMGVPKTIDNDLFGTDHCPGYGSVIKYMATMTMEIGRDTEAMYTTDTVSIVEAMGRHTGWIAAGTALAKRTDEDAPHMILLPEVPFDKEHFKSVLQSYLTKYKRATIVVSEGTKYPDGTFLGEQKGEFSKDSFGHTQLGGAALSLKSIVENEVKVKARFVIPSLAQRSAMHFASKTDSDEAYLVGAKAVELAITGESGYMTTIQRVSNNPYKTEIGKIELSKVANGEHLLPNEWISEEEFFVKQKFFDYALPLIQGEVPIKMKQGLPVFMRFQKHFI